MNKMKGDTLLTAEGKPLTSETGQYACQQNPSRKKKKKKEGKENRAETLDRDFSVMS